MLLNEAFNKENSVFKIIALYLDRPLTWYNDKDFLTGQSTLMTSISIGSSETTTYFLTTLPPTSSTYETETPTYELSTRIISTSVGQLSTIDSISTEPSTIKVSESTMLSTKVFTSIITSTTKSSTTAESQTTIFLTLAGPSTTGLSFGTLSSEESTMAKVSSSRVSTYMTFLPTVIGTIDFSLIFSSIPSPSFSETFYTEGL